MRESGCVEGDGVGLESGEASLGVVFEGFLEQRSNITLLEPVVAVVVIMVNPAVGVQVSEFLQPRDVAGVVVCPCIPGMVGDGFDLAVAVVFVVELNAEVIYLVFFPCNHLFGNFPAKVVVFES